MNVFHEQAFFSLTFTLFDLVHLSDNIYCYIDIALVTRDGSPSGFTYFHRISIE